jgi:hypothetical protein
MATERTDRWAHLVSGAFNLEEQGGRPPNALEAMVRYLDSVLEVFPSGIDPVDDFEGYAVRRMAVALRGRLGAMREQGAGKGQGRRKKR